jgi:hypothetical protein
MPETAVAFLSNRKLYVRKNGATQLIESEFERTVRERAASIERRHAWKTQGRGAMFTGHALAAQANAVNQVPVLLTGLTAGQSGRLFYSMETDAVSGIFLLDAEGVETRLFHTADFRVRHAALHPDGTTLAVSAFHKDNMRSSIAVLPVQGTDFSEVTEGDSFDQFPQWVPGEHVSGQHVSGTKRRIVFQSAGIGRDAAGRFAGLGPCAIQQLDLDSGDLEELASDSDRDLLQPRQAEDGSLYYIRKPYESSIPKASLLGSLNDAAMFPFRMARALFQYFNFFSMMYSGKPLVTNKGAVQKQMDPRQMFIYGNLAAARMAQSQEDDVQNRVPSSWELVRSAPGGQKEVVARGVLAFDLAPGGAVLYSDGSSITRLSSDGQSERLLQCEQIERLIAL